MKSRLTALLSGLLLFCAIFGTPVARVSVFTNRVSCTCVYSEQRDRHAEQIAEISASQPPAPPELLLPAPRDLAHGITLDFSLFQRPPPALSL
jgi:hypothetical protein